jgi:hypothetical protein
MSAAKMQTNEIVFDLLTAFSPNALACRLFDEDISAGAPGDQY